MAVDIARVRSGIGIKLTPSSLFGKKMSTRARFLQYFRRPQSLSTQSLTPGATPSFLTRFGLVPNYLESGGFAA